MKVCYTYSFLIIITTTISCLLWVEIETGGCLRGRAWARMRFRFSSLQQTWRLFIQKTNADTIMLSTFDISVISVHLMEQLVENWALLEAGGFQHHGQGSDSSLLFLPMLFLWLLWPEGSQHTWSLWSEKKKISSGSFYASYYRLADRFLLMFQC